MSNDRNKAKAMKGFTLFDNELNRIIEADVELQLLWTRSQNLSNHIRDLSPNKASERINRDQIEKLVPQLHEVTEKYHARRAQLEKDYNDRKSKEKHDLTHLGLTKFNLWVAFISLLAFIILTFFQVYYERKSFKVQEKLYILERSKIRDEIFKIESKIYDLRKEMKTHSIAFKDEDFKRKIENEINHLQRKVQEIKNSEKKVKKVREGFMLMKHRYTNIDKDIKADEIKALEKVGEEVVATLYSGDQYISTNNFDDVESWWKQKKKQNLINVAKMIFGKK